MQLCGVLYLFPQTGVALTSESRHSLFDTPQSLSSTAAGANVRVDFPPNRKLDAGPFGSIRTGIQIGKIVGHRADTLTIFDRAMRREQVCGGVGMRASSEIVQLFFQISA